MGTRERAAVRAGAHRGSTHMERPGERKGQLSAAAKMKKRRRVESLLVPTASS